MGKGRLAAFLAFSNRSLVLEALRDRPDLDGCAGAAARTRGVFRHADACEEQRREVVRLAKEGRHLRVEERHPGRAGTEGVCSEVEPALDEPGRELGVAVAAVIEQGQRRGADDDVGSVGGERLVQADALQLVAQVPGPRGVDRSGQR